MSSYRSSRRPGGVTALACLFAFGVLASSFALVTLAVPGTPLDTIWRINPRGHEAFLRTGAWAFLLLAIVCIACAASAFGLLTNRQWGYRMAMVMLAVNFIGDLVNFLSGNEPRAIVGVPIVAMIVWYLATPKVRKHFFPPRDLIRLDVRPL